MIRISTAVLYFRMAEVISPTFSLSMAAVSSVDAWIRYPTSPSSRLVGSGSDNNSEWSLEEFDLSETVRRKFIFTSV